MYNLREVVSSACVTLLGLAALFSSHAAGAGEALPAQSSAPTLALTFDDLPLHGPLPAGQTSGAVVDVILKALKRAGVTQAYGFINAQGAESDPALARVLQNWRDAGYPLGNHSWSHQNLNALSLEAFEQELVRNEPPLRQLMGPRDWRWFRYPFLAEGDDPAKRLAVRALLATRGYRVAPVTMDFGDWQWTAPYARCSAAADNKAIATMETWYLAAARENADVYRSMAQSLYGRDIPYVLLMHVGAFDARMLPRLLQLYADMGFRFAKLADSLADPVYDADRNLGLPPKPHVLEERMIEAKMTVPVRHSYAAELDGLCRTTDPASEVRSR